MKKLFFVLILTFLTLTINANTAEDSVNGDGIVNDKILKIGVLLPLSGTLEPIGQAFLNAVQLGVHDLKNKNIKIYPKDSKGNALDSYKAAKEFEKLGIKIVIGPLLYESNERLGEINNVSFISLTNKTENLSKNIIAFGVNVNSQIEVIKKYFKKNNISKTILLSPKNNFEKQTNLINSSKLNFYKTFLYDENPKKITGEIEKITNYRERKKDLERRIKILEKSDLEKDKRELLKLEQRHTLGGVNFDSVFVVDFGEQLKSIITSFVFADVTSENVNFFSLNQWFDETLFSEKALQNLHFPSIDLKNLNKFEKKYLKAYNEKPNKVSLLAYDALGLIYYCWANNNKNFKTDSLYNKDGFKGLLGEFYIKNNLAEQKLKIYKISGEKFIKVF